MTGAPALRCWESGAGGEVARSRFTGTVYPPPTTRPAVRLGMGCDRSGTWTSHGMTLPTSQSTHLVAPRDNESPVDAPSMPQLRLGAGDRAGPTGHHFLNNPDSR
jgi:hypothetical protein